MQTPVTRRSLPTLRLERGRFFSGEEISAGMSTSSQSRFSRKREFPRSSMLTSFPLRETKASLKSRASTSADPVRGEKSSPLEIATGASGSELPTRRTTASSISTLWCSRLKNPEASTTVPGGNSSRERVLTRRARS